MTIGKDFVLEPRKFVAPEFVCGTGVLNLVGHYAENQRFVDVLPRSWTR